ncbi:carbon-nitrogen hydrolase [Stutzerimonas azotifigens]|uniref:Carbon-nitrogen hydrolase n=1 Tax=Stutzerimonas azotifigens TaxID=291995 RepID=A0ABR5Z351_9GAMM|nr:carbon-nitrogen hydrolase [Stutzerimonas azotifigens]MBA1274577.1 carbon-nitrogen hydrolase [Stutzerimonas azotifigens]
MRRLLRLALIALLSIAALVLYLQWTRDRDSGPLLSDLRLLPIISEGEPNAGPNLLGVETHLMPADYQSRERLHLKFATYLEQARQAGMLGPQTVVVLPEHVGTGLFALGEKAEVQQARTLRDAMQLMAMSNPFHYLGALLANEGDDRRTDAVLRMKASQMAEAYQSIFGQLAAEFGVTLVAGSVVLPEPRLENRRLSVGDGPLRQVSLVFDPSGQPLDGLWHKRSVSRYERRYSDASDQAQPAPVDTPAGRLQVALGCDAYAGVDERTEVLAIPGAVVIETCGHGAHPLPQELPQVAVATLGLPWNLLGSPRRAAAHNHQMPVRLTNRWLPERS